MRKIATLALASALSIAALAPAAFAGQGECTGKQFAGYVQQAQQDGLRGQAKKSFATENCAGPAAETPPAVECSVFAISCP